MRDAAFTRLYKEHVDFVWRLARSLGVDRMHVDDTVHEVFLVVRRRIAERDERSSVRAWIAGITRNVVLHHHRASRREAARREHASAPAALRGPDDELDLVEAAELMHAFLDELDDARREVFALIEIEGFSAPEVAALCGVKLPTVYTRLRAARAELVEFTARIRSSAPARGGDRDG